MGSFLKNNRWIFFITIILFIIPFFWIKPNEMDLGGDSGRLYFYDPLNYLVNNSLYFSEIITLENRSFFPQFYFLPYVTDLLLIKSIINSPYFLISFISGIKMSISFLSVYLIIRIILQNSYKEKKELFLQAPSILGGLLYTTAPIVIGNYGRALISHDQIFLNPLCFFLILYYFIKGKFRYLLTFIVVTVIFASNFSWVSAPPFFAFFPLSLLFIFLYALLVLKKKINYFYLLIAVVLFFGLHAFHIIPEAYSLLSPNNYFNQRVFSHSSMQDTLNYFFGVLPLSKLSFNILLYAPFKQYSLLSIIPLFLLLLGLCFKRDEDKTLFLIGTFFLITLFLVTANITHLGVTLYVFFYTIPGFSMFRNFIGQWAFVYSFFYALLFGQALYFLFKKIRNIKFLIVLVIFIGLSFVASSWNFFTGGIVNSILFQTNNVKVPMVMDPKYEQTLLFIRNLTDTGAFVSFPFTDSYETVIHGLNEGAYEGLSPIYFLTGKIDYNGYRQISPFGEMFFKLVKEKNYSGIKKLFGLLNIQYVYYNDDPKIYDNTFPGNPYNSARAVFPATQTEYKDLINSIAGKEIYHYGTYHIYEVDKKYFHPQFYVAKNLKTYKQPQTEMYMQTEPFFDFSSQVNDVFVDDASCLKMLSKAFCSKDEFQLSEQPRIQFEKVNPTMYRVYVYNAKQAYLLVFSKSFYNDWDISLSKNNNLEDLLYPKRLPEKQVVANGYANAWYISPKDVGNRSNYTITIQLSVQKTFYIGAAISIITFVIAGIYGIFFLSRK